MKYLKELTLKINDDLFQKFLDEKCTNTEKELLKIYRSDSELETDKDISLKLSIKLSTLKKLQSNTLNELINYCSGKEIIKRINFLANLSCHKLLLHIVRKEILSLEDIKDFTTLKQLYFELPSRFLNADIYTYELKEIEVFATKFKEISNDEIKHSRIDFVLILLSLQRIVKIDSNYKKTFLQKINAIPVFDNIPLMVWKNTLLHTYYSKFDILKQKEYIEKNYTLCIKNSDAVSEQTLINNKLHYCLYIINDNQFEETYQVIKEIFTKHKKRIGINLRFVDLYYQICIKLGKYAEAKKVIFEYHHIDSENLGKNAEENFDVIANLAMIDILESKYDSAFEKISIAKNGLKKQYFLVFDCIIRLVEQAYFYKIKEYDLADSLYQKNLKFYKYNDDKTYSNLKNAHKIINYYCKLDFSKKSLSKKMIQYIKDLNQGESAFVGHFIEHII